MLTRGLWMAVLFAMAMPMQTPVSNDPICVQHAESLQYPTLPLFAQIQGEVKVVVKVDADGRVVSAAGTSGHDLLRRAAEENVKKWTFRPGSSEQTLTISYKFVLQNPPFEYPHTECSFDLPDTVTVLSNRQAPLG